MEFLISRPAKFVPQRGMDVRRTAVGHDEYECWGPVRLATPIRLTVDLLINRRLRRSLPRTVGLLDAILRAELVDGSTLVGVLKQRHEHGIVRAREALDLADPRAESVPESELRVWLTQAGLAPEVQVEVFDQFGRFLGRLDLAYREYKVAVEYDGEWHSEGDQPELDARRRERLRAAGWEVIVVTKDQLYGDPKAVVATVQATIGRRARKRSA